MNISIIGTGNIGAALGNLIASYTTHSLTFGARDPKPVAGLPRRVTTTTPAEAVRANEIVILATPFPALREVVKTLGGADALAGKILIDVSNPLTADLMGLTVSGQDSAGETVARTFPAARVVKAFNTVFAPVLAGHQPSQRDTTAPTVFVAGDHADAKAKVIALAAKLGFDALDAGPLTNSRYLEGTLEQMMQLAQGQGMGNNIRLRVLRG
jgi:8-hydroxy-5-deazaflavin:NADPH oxidoreductase